MCLSSAFFFFIFNLIFSGKKNNNNKKHQQQKNKALESFLSIFQETFYLKEEDADLTDTHGQPLWRDRSQK